VSFVLHFYIFYSSFSSHTKKRMTVSNSDIESQRSILCGCCRFGHKKRRLNEINETKLFEPSTSTVPLTLNESIPQIVISTPSSSNAQKYLFTNNNGLDTGRSEIYTTARTSRIDDTNQYTSMTELVRNIREEAGFEDTPRSKVGTTVSELRIEGLAEITSNNREPSLPSPSKEFYFPETTENQSVVPMNAPSMLSQQNYRPSINRKLGDLTVKVYKPFFVKLRLFFHFCRFRKKHFLSLKANSLRVD
jgi:hypothetical protein